MNLQVLWLQKEEEDITNSTDVSDVEMTRFGQRIDLIRERHVRVKDEAKIASRGTDWDDIIDGSRSSLFKFIQERMSVKVLVSVSRDRAEFVGVKEMFSWVSSAYKWYR